MFKTFIEFLFKHAPTALIPQENPMDTPSDTYNGYLKAMISFFEDLPFQHEKAGKILYLLLNLKATGPRPKREGTITARNLIENIEDSCGRGEITTFEALDLKVRIRECVSQSWNYYNGLKLRRQATADQLDLFI